MKNITTFPLKQLDRFKKIYVLVSGGIDSTYLFELIREKYPNRTIPVNCVNIYESNPTLRKINQLYNVLQIKPNLKGKKIRDVLIDAFKQIPKAKELRKNKKYNKKVFGCCKILKHEMFKKNPLFIEPGSVVISGIKRGDGQQRMAFLVQLMKGKEIIGTSKTPNNYTGGTNPTFFHKHKWGATYCYPFRDFKKRYLPDEIIEELMEKYPKLKSSGCFACPVLIVFQDLIEKRGSEDDKLTLNRSLKFLKYLEDNNLL